GAFRRFWEEIKANGDFRGHKANKKRAGSTELPAQATCHRTAGGPQVSTPPTSNAPNGRKWQQSRFFRNWDFYRQSCVFYETPFAYCSRKIRRFLCCSRSRRLLMAMIEIDLDMPEGLHLCGYERIEQGHAFEVDWPVDDTFTCQRCRR